MIKYLFLLLNFISFLLIDLFFGEVNVAINAPADAYIDSSFVVEVTISKSDMTGFARYQQDFPIGYSVSDIQGYNGEPTFKDQKLKIIWFVVPSDSVYKISYKVKIDKTVAEGPFILGGTFNYIYENEVKTYSIPTHTVAIHFKGYVASNNTNVNQNNQTDAVQNQNNGVDTSSQQNNVSNVTNNFPVNEFFCYRQIVPEGNSLAVHLLINTVNLTKDKFAKIQETIPPGYTATNVESKEGIFSFKDNNVKFLWMALPTQSQFEVCYKLTANGPSMGMPDIAGNFSYIENEATKVVSIQNRDFLNNALIASNNTNNQQDNNTTNNNQNTNQNNTDNNTNQNNNSENNTNNQNNNSNQNNANNQANLNNQQNNNQNTIVSPETGVRYKVQIAAGHKPVNAKYYFKQFSVNETVQMETHEGWHKYTIGSFTIYKDARDRRVQIWQNTPIRDAFVSAYNNGSRITVQEALMVANQKWYQ